MGASCMRTQDQFEGYGKGSKPGPAPKLKGIVMAE